jgi:hypothetical protein
MPPVKFMEFKGKKSDYYIVPGDGKHINLYALAKQGIPWDTVQPLLIANMQEELGPRSPPPEFIRYARMIYAQMLLGAQRPEDLDIEKATILSGTEKYLDLNMGKK